MTGGESWVDESVQDGFLSCSTLDVVSLHAYSPGDYNTTFLETYVQRAQAAHKKLIMEEWSVFSTIDEACLLTQDYQGCVLFQHNQ